MKDNLSYLAKNGVEVKYIRKNSKYDYHHILFVFSGFGGEEPKQIDFINALNDFPGEVVWILDNFYGNYSYYLCNNMNFDIEIAVSEFIDQVVGGCYESNQITFSGFSKGGSAALYFALKHDIKNVVVTVPQSKIGSYVKNNWPKVAISMMGENYSKSRVDYLDRFIVEKIKKDKLLDRNIYLLTSEADIQYKEEVYPLLDDLKKYQNFNLLMTHSAFIREHNQVTSHHVPLLLSIFYALASEATPIFKDVHFFGKVKFENKVISDQVHIELDSLEIRNNRLFIDGVGIIRGIDLEDWEDISYSLFLVNAKSTYNKLLAKAHKPHLTKRLFDGTFVVYDKGWFTTIKYAGVDLMDLPKGEYSLDLEILAKGQKALIRLSDSLNKVSFSECEKFALYSTNDSIYLRVK